MNQLYQLISMLAKAMFKKDSPIVPDDAFPPMSEPGIVLEKTRTMTTEGKINEAENLLFDVLDKAKPYYMAIGLDFYAHLCELDDQTLVDADFSREEVQQGVGDLLNFYGVKISVKKNPPPAAAEPQPNPAPNVMADPPKMP